MQDEVMHDNNTDEDDPLCHSNVQLWRNGTSETWFWRTDLQARPSSIEVPDDQLNLLNGDEGRFSVLLQIYDYLEANGGQPGPIARCQCPDTLHLPCSAFVTYAGTEVVCNDCTTCPYCNHCTFHHCTCRLPGMDRYKMRGRHVNNPVS